MTAITTNQEAGWYLGLDDEVVYRIDRRNLEALGSSGCQKIKGVASDGAQGFLAATREYAPQALIVLDHFHPRSCTAAGFAKSALFQLRNPCPMDPGEEKLS